MIANGSTLGDGTWRAEVTAQVYWLRAHQHVNGFAVAQVPCPRNAHLLGVLALTEAGEVSQHHPLVEASRVGITRVAATMCGDAARPATVEEFVAAMLLARSATVAERAPDEIGQIEVARSAARARMVPGKVRCADAALHLDELLQGRRHPPELTVALACPANLVADPLHTMVGALAVARTDEKTRAAWFATLTALVAARETKGEHAGTWAPAGGFDRITTTAMHAITLALANGETPLFCAK
jgi:hypothetical protein